MQARDKSEQERLALTRKILDLEYLEDDFLSLKKRHEEKLLNLQSEFHDLSNHIEWLLINTPTKDWRKALDLEDNQSLKYRMENEINEHLDDLENYSRSLRFKWDDERDKLYTERNHLPWE